MPTEQQRQAEIDKYSICYSQTEYHYGIGAQRMVNAIQDLKWAFALGCRSFLDVGCGRGELLDRARAIGFTRVQGVEPVPELVAARDDVIHGAAHAVPFGDNEFDLVGSFDVIEHIFPPDDDALLKEIGRIATKCVIVVAHNCVYHDPVTGTDLHVNKRPFDEWGEKFKLAFPGSTQQRMSGRQYASIPWRINLNP
jgi:SAM-dependent methyltransferase